LAFVVFEQDFDFYFTWLFDLVVNCVLSIILIMIWQGISFFSTVSEAIVIILI